MSYEANWCCRQFKSDGCRKRTKFGHPPSGILDCTHCLVIFTKVRTVYRFSMIQVIKIEIKTCITIPSIMHLSLNYKGGKEDCQQAEHGGKGPQ